MAKATVLAAAGAGLLIVVVLVLQPWADERAAVVAGPAGDRQVAAPLERGDQSGQDRSPTNQVGQGEHSSAPTNRSVRASESPPHEVVPFSEEAFALKYESFSLEELKVAAKAISVAMPEQRTLAYEAAYAAGFFTRFPYQQDDSGKQLGPHDVIEVPAADRPLFKELVASDAEGEWHLVTIPKEGHAALYAMQPEYKWIKDRMGDFHREESARKRRELDLQEKEARARQAKGLGQDDG
jgi:hypothetical protein